MHGLGGSVVGGTAGMGSMSGNSGGAGSLSGHSGGGSNAGSGGLDVKPVRTKPRTSAGKQDKSL